MIQRMTPKKNNSIILILCMAIGLLTALFLVYQRDRIEEAQNHIENIVDYDAVLRASAFEKRSTHDAFKALKASGVTAFAIYDRTLEKANDAGEIQLLNAQDLSTNVQLYGANYKAGALYVASVPGKEGYFKEIREDLVHRLGADKVGLVNSSRGLLLELTGAPYEAFSTMKLSISRLQAQEVSNRGFNVIVRPTNFKNVTLEDTRYVFSRINDIPNVTGIVFTGKEILGAPKYLDETLKELNSRNIPLIGIEAVNQLQYDPQAGFNELAAMKKYSVGRLYTIAKDELKKITPEEASQRYYISDIERNIRFNLFPLYEDGQNNTTSLQTTINYIAESRDKLAEKGFEFGRGDVYPSYNPNPLLVVVTMVGSIALFVFVLQMLVAMRTHKQLVLFFALSLASIVVYIITSGTMITLLWALSAAVMAPVGAMIMVMDHWKSIASDTPVGPWRATGYALMYLVGAALFAAVGAMFIASMLGNTRFFMEFAIFRGVKLTFVLPIVLVAIAYLQRFPLWKGRMLNSKEEAINFVKEFLTMDVRFYVFLVVGALATVGYVFVGRSGHTAGVPVPAAELMLRRFLENTLYARPREKEFIIGHPAFMLATFAFLRKWPLVIHFILTIASVIGIASMVETFCHLRTPVMMSIMRGVDGLWIGAILGVVAILAARFLIYVAQWYQQREVNHE